MRLNFVTEHLSIKIGEPIEIPDFTVLTGLNGAGKSHLLGAIVAKAVQIDKMPNAVIADFDRETFRVSAESRTTSADFSQKRQLFRNFVGEERFKGVFSPSPGLRAGLEPYLDGENIKLWDLKVDDEHLAAQLEAYKYNILVEMSTGLHASSQNAQVVLALVKRISGFICDLSLEDLDRYFYPLEENRNFLPRKLSEVFLDYYEKYDLNRYRRYLNHAENENYDVLDDDVFFKRYGHKPWDVMNRILADTANLGYRVNEPGRDQVGGFQIRLQSTRDPALEVGFEDLSSGESALMALVASVYKQAIEGGFPQVLLLDEIDASLHPSMIKIMLEVIQRVFVDEGVKVILVTHSPTTVALCPAGSLFLMSRNTHPRLSPVTVADALSILTDGFVTLDEGLRLFDEASKNDVSIVSEGNNIEYIEKALALYGVQGVKVIRGLESASGIAQLKSMYEFFSRVKHKGKIIIVWDCDAKQNCKGLESGNNTYPFVFELNPQSKCRKGIENLFSDELLDGYCIEDKFGEHVVTRVSDKKGLMQHILARGNKQDFVLFHGLLNLIQEVKGVKELA